MKNQAAVSAGRPVTTVVVLPANPSLVYIGLQQRGVYRKDDGGKTLTSLVTDPVEPGQNTALSRSVYRFRGVVPS